MTIIAWQYDGDRFCTQCTERKYRGSTRHGSIPYEDSEGNPILPVYSWDEIHEPSITGCQPTGCGDCGEILDVTHDPDCPNGVLGRLWNDQCVPMEE